MSNQILIADTDQELRKQLETLLVKEGFQVEQAESGETALKKALNQSFAAIILDIMLPEKNGLEVLKSIREYAQTPVIILTSRQNDMDKLLSFELGADDFLHKPCSQMEFMARLKSVLKRAPNEPSEKPTIAFESIKMDSSTRTATINMQPLELTKAEFNILEMLIKSPGQAFSKEELTEYALGRAFTAYDRSIDVHISNLRNKLGQNKNGEDWIKTVRGFGYILNK